MFKYHQISINLNVHAVIKYMIHFIQMYAFLHRHKIKHAPRFMEFQSSNNVTPEMRLYRNTALRTVCLI
jgi:hypothetical protein